MADAVSIVTAELNIRPEPDDVPALSDPAPLSVTANKLCDGLDNLQNNKRSAILDSVSPSLILQEIRESITSMCYQLYLPFLCFRPHHQIYVPSGSFGPLNAQTHNVYEAYISPLVTSNRVIASAENVPDYQPLPDDLIPANLLPTQTWERESNKYMKDKPNKWGFKNYVRAGVLGIIYMTVKSGGEDTFRYHTFPEEE
ncbi:hypothetical protein K1T71_014982 [Dendrolimus kikuchii]|nr:hypothetical protein K1T71_014982 [Dendrolimus kikuchii]